MRGGAPPDIETTHVAQNTNAAPNTNTTTQLLAPPGLTRRYRIWGYQFSWQTSGITAGANAHAIMRSNPTNNRRVDAFINEDGNGTQTTMIPGGMICGTNSEVQVIDRCTVASQSIIHRVWYTVEEVP